MRKNSIFILALSIMLSMPVFATEGIVPDVVPETIETEQAVLTENNDNQDLTVIDTDVKNKTIYKEPVSKRKMAKKFLKAMLAVVASSLIIFIGLSLYNRLRDSFSTQAALTSGPNETDLETPEDMDEALRSFMDKTHWEG